MSGRKDRLFIHIGMPRAGSTLLQQMVFPNWNRVSYVGPPYTFYNHNFQRLLFADDTHYSHGAMDDEMKRWRGKRLLLSDENLVGQPLYWQFGNRTRTLERLGRLMPDSGIILFLRAQPDLLRSQYTMAMIEGYYEGPNRYLAHRGSDFSWDNQWVGEIPRNRYAHALLHSQKPSEWLEGYRYVSLINLCERLFPTIAIFLYEDLRDDPDGTLNRLARLTGHEHHGLDLPLPEMNQGANSQQVRRLRKWNKFKPLCMASRSGRALWYRVHRRIMRRSKDAPAYRLNSGLEERLRRYYAGDNAELARRYPHIGLERHSEAYGLNHQE